MLAGDRHFIHAASATTVIRVPVSIVSFPEGVAHLHKAISLSRALRGVCGGSQGTARFVPAISAGVLRGFPGAQCVRVTVTDAHLADER